MNSVNAAHNIFHYALDAVLPRHLIERRIQCTGNKLQLGAYQINPDDYRNIYIIGAGKASAAMAVVLENVLGKRLTDGVCIVKYGHGVPLQKVKVIEAGHPIPDENGILGGKAILTLAEKTTEDDLVFCVISGGGSALLVAPRQGISLEDMQEFSSLLLRAGADIHELNTVRKHLSLVKGGQLARYLSPSKIVTLLISDVIGDSLDIIASGPTVPDPSTYSDAQKVLEKYGLIDKMPASILDNLDKGINGKLNDTPEQGDPLFNNVTNWIIGNNQFALQAAAHKAKLLGYNPCIISSCVFGESRHIAHNLVAIARETAQCGNPVHPPACLIMGGETTVTVKGEGKGGRCTEFALSAGMAMEKSDRFVILAAGTDGTDGPTDAAGAVVTPDTISDAEANGVHASHYLKNNDSYSFFKKTGNLITTGPTLTNVMDIMMAVIPE